MATSQVETMFQLEVPESLGATPVRRRATSTPVAGEVVSCSPLLTPILKQPSCANRSLGETPKQLLKLTDSPLPSRRSSRISARVADQQLNQSPDGIVITRGNPCHFVTIQ